MLLADLLAEDRKPPAALWDEDLISSRLLEYETMVRVNAYGLEASHGQAARDRLGNVSFIELAPAVLERALQPFPQTVRTLDALHLSSLLFLRSLRIRVSLAAYDDRLRNVAGALKIPLYKGL